MLYPVAAAGGMALTLYTAQAIALTIVREANRIDADTWTYPDATLPCSSWPPSPSGHSGALFLGAGPLERLVRLLTALPAPT